ncbi:MAG: Maf family protein [Bacteroidota bacterium]
MAFSEFVLASGSPRRRRLLSQLGLSFRVHPSLVEERIPDSMSDPADIVEYLAQLKAEDIAQHYPDAVVLGADTIVVLDGEILGKPDTVEDAHQTLRRLAGRSHDVFTGLALVCSGETTTSHERTRVVFAALSVQEIEDYVATGSPMDKAGSYGIQDDRGALLVEGIEGDFYNVVGLPLRKLYTEFTARFGREAWAQIQIGV